ncbi:MAG: TonB-dependent receptor, partial [Alphaproteobacteria bacterium HGW-Alphaproteobacteria-5]
PAATISTNLVDINNLPNALIKRVEIVTGGASAAWGSDAVAGVVNFILDTKFTGIKGDIQGSMTTYRDDEGFRVTLAGGTPFASGRGHILLSGELSYNDGIKALPRPWYTGAKRFANPAYAAGNGEPEFLVQTQTGFATAAPGAVVTSGPLRGLLFGENGAVSQLNYGSIVSGQFMTGGDWEYTDFGQGPQDLAPRLTRQNLFGRVSYEISDNVEVYGQFSYGRARTVMNSTPQFNFGNITISRENAFLPDAIGERMDDLGLTTLTVGSWNADLGGILAETVRTQYRYEVGAMGGFNAFGSEWSWDAYAAHNESRIFNSARTTVTARYREAIDSVLVDGVAMCRSTLTNPGNGCVPYNILGTGTASEPAKNYVLGTASIRGKIKQDIFAASLQGSPFATWAGPVSVALGFEHRRDAISSVADPLSLTRSYWAGNFQPYSGSITVNEGFLEVVVPLAADAAWAKSLDVNAAVRGTDYSSSGFVATWKVGLSYAPVDDIRLRVTRSRDIRAGSLPELYAAGQAQTFTIPDPFRGNANTTYFQIQGGNPGLKPEKADTLNIGAVFTPTFLPGFAASVDYFDIKIKDAVTTVSGATSLQRCYDGVQSLCDQIVRNSAGEITEIYVRPINFARQAVRGLDLEASYRIPLGDGAITVRGMATRYLRAVLDDGINLPNPSLGENLPSGTPKWQYRASIAYDGSKVSMSLTGRGVSAGVYDATFTECASACPASTAASRTINNNRIDGALYFDATAGVKVYKGVELYLAVDNLFNKDPAIAAHGPSVGSAPLGVYATYYDLIGRTFRGGIRFKM